MSDVVIRGMEMPKSCEECRLFNESWCMALSVENWRKSYNKPPEGGRLPDCPLVPLPEGHGRLVDADKLAKRLKDFVDWCRDDRRAGAFFVMDCPLPDSPTIVPAEGGTTNDGNAS